MKIRFVVATRERKKDFPTGTATGRSLALYDYPSVEVLLFAHNTLGLPLLYNKAIEAAKHDPAILVFIHDDVHICGFDWPLEIKTALDRFQLIGVAGNKRRAPFQPSWAFVDTNLRWDAKENLSGIVGHGKGFPPANLSKFGPSRQEVKLLDGLLLACHSQTMIDCGLRFDERFDFHFYDLDLCRQAEALNLRMGTWPLSVIHQSAGNFGSDDWIASCLKYFEKWGD